VEDLKLLQVVELEGHLEHVQGIDVEDGQLWVSSVSREARKGWVRLFDLTGRRLREVEVQQDAQYHPGGIAVDGGALWVPVAEYRASSSTTVQKRDKRTLDLLGSFRVNDHIGCIARVGGRLVGGNWDSRLIYEWTPEGRELRQTPNPAGVAFQDWKAVGGGRLLGAGIREKQAGALVLMNAKNWTVMRSWTAGKTDRGVWHTNEGVAVRGKRLYLLPEDGRSRLFVYEFGV